MTFWIVAYCNVTREWSSGGRPSAYERPYWDLYRVEASNRTDAENAGRKLRQKHRRINEKEKSLLAALLDQVPQDDEGAEVRFEDVATLSSLMSKQLVTVAADADTGLLRARLTLAAFNHRDRPDPTVTLGHP